MFNSFGNLTLFDDDDVDVDGYMGSVDNSVIDTDEEQDCSTPVQGPATKTEQESTNRSYSEVLRSGEAQAPASTLMSSKRGSSYGAGPSKREVWLKSLDLHGKTLYEATLAVIEKLQPLSNLRYDTIFEVITGIGNRSEGKPVLPEKIPELLGMFSVNIKVTSKGGALIVTIPARTELYLSFGGRHQVDFDRLCHAQLELKGASISNAQALVSHSGMDVVVRKVNAFVQEIRCREREKLLMPILKKFFGEENDKYYLSRQDLIAFWEMKAVDATLISTYMRYLDGKYENREIIEFVNPASISTTDDKELSQRINKRLGRRKNSQLCFFPFPYNIQSTFHWVLMVIDCSSMVVYWVDSLHGEPDDSTKNNVMNWLDTPLPPTWKFIRGPKQTDSVQCGYYLMKYMKDLMCETSQSIKRKMESLDRIKYYPGEEIKKVRVELFDYCREY